MSVNSAMTAIADEIRSILGISGSMGLDAMGTNLGTVRNDLTSAFAAVGNKGGTVPASKVSGNLAGAIASIVTGGGSGGGGSGGLPSGVSALTFGTFTPTSDCTSDWPVYHDLGQTPNFFLFYTRDAYAISDLAGYYFMQAAIPRRVLPEGAIILGSFVSTSNMINTTMAQEELMTTMSRDLFVVDAASNRKLKAGVTYNWMCGVIDMGE